MIITSEKPSTRADGSVVIHWQTITSTLPVTPVYVPTVVPVSQQNANSNARPVNLGPVIGGVVGGFFGLIGIVAVLWFFLSVLLPLLSFNMLNNRLAFFLDENAQAGVIYSRQRIHTFQPPFEARGTRNAASNLIWTCNPNLISMVSLVKYKQQPCLHRRVLQLRQTHLSAVTRPRGMADNDRLSRPFSSLPLPQPPGTVCLQRLLQGHQPPDLSTPFGLLPNLLLLRDP